MYIAIASIFINTAIASIRSDLKETGLLTSRQHCMEESRVWSLLIRIVKTHLKAREHNNRESWHRGRD